MDLLRSLPLGLYLEQPVTWLHRLDARVKLAWLMGFLATPILANSLWRLALVGVLILLTFLAGIPLRVWRQQMGWLIILCLLIFVLSCLFDDGIPVDHYPRLPEPQTEIEFPQPEGYDYVIFEQSWVKVTQRSFDLAIRISTLLFVLIYSTNLYLLTTAPEEITAGLESLMQPLRALKVPVTEISLTLTLSLRFIPLVLEEVQNLIRSVTTRAINWKKLGIRRSFQIWLTVAERLLDNLLLRAEQIATAMEVRGFTSPNQHRVRWHRLRLYWGDWIALAVFLLFLGGRLIWGGA